MYIVIDERDSGKTYKLLECANRNHGMVLTQDKRSLKVKAEAYGFNNLPIIDYNDLKNDTFPLGKTLYIHNADKVLSYLFKQFYLINVAGFSATIKKKGDEK